MSDQEIKGYIDEPERLRERISDYPALPRESRKELIGGLSRLRDEKAGEFLTAVFPAETDRELQKLIRKGLFKLKTMGIKVEEPRAEGETVLKAIEDERQHMGFMSNYDIEGTRIVVVAFEVRKGYYIFANAVQHVFKGLVSLKLVPLARHDLDEIIAEYTKASDSLNAFAGISAAYAAYLIDEADSVMHHYADNVREIRKFASGIKEGVRMPADIYSLPVPDDVVLLPLSAVLSDDPFKPFSLSWDTMEADRKSLDAVAGSTLLLPPHMVREKLEKMLADLLEKESLKSKIPVVKRLLEDYGYIYFVSGRLDAFATIMALLGNDNGPKGALSFFVGKALDMKEPSNDPQSNLIVSPYGQVRR